MLAIFRQTFREALRKKIFVLVLVTTLGFLALYGTALHFANVDRFMQNDFTRNLALSQMLSLGLYFSSFICGFLAIMASVGSIAAEIENGTLYAIVPKPITRGSIFLGKFLGLAWMVIIYSVVYYLVIILLNQIMSNWGLNFLNARNIFYGSLFLCLHLLIILSISMFGTVHFPTLNNGIFVTMFYGIGVIGGMIEQVAALMQNISLTNIGIISSLIMPTDVIYRKMMSTLLNEGVINYATAGPFFGPKEPSVWMVIYAVCYAAFFLYLGLRKFNKRDI
jgi:Cu-processing system permease protein